MRRYVLLVLMIALCSSFVLAGAPVTAPMIILSKVENPFNLTANTTDDLPEGSTNLYYTSTRDQNTIYDISNFSSDLATITTNNITEGSNNLYYTSARDQNTIYDDNNFSTNIAGITTTNITEGTNLYYTVARWLADFNSNRLWNRTGSNVFLNTLGDLVGIGTSTPSHELNVIGDVNITNDLFVGRDLNVTRNATFQQDITVIGNLIGGSPIKIIGGVNVITGSYSGDGRGITNLNLTNISFTGGNITANFFIGDGSKLTGVVATAENQTRGELFNHSGVGYTLDLVTVDVWENVTNLIPNLLNGFNSTPDGLISDVAGTYQVTTTISFAGQSGSIIASGVSVNGSPKLNTRALRTVSAGGALGSMNGVGFIELDIGDVVNFQVRTTTLPVKDITIVHANLNLVRVGD